MTLAETSPAGGRSVVGGDPAGRITITSRALGRAAAQAATDVLGVTRSDVAAQVGDARSGLLITVTSPVPAPDLTDIRSRENPIPLLDRLAMTQRELQARVEQVTGRDVARLNLVVSGAVLPRVRRVR